MEQQSFWATPSAKSLEPAMWEHFMNSNDATVFIVDDDSDIRDSLRVLMESVRLNTRSYDSAIAFLDDLDESAAGCLLLDVRMPGMGGLDLQEELVNRGVILPIIIITGHADVPMAVKTLQIGAFDFVEKPYQGQLLVDCVWRAIRQNEKAREERAELKSKRTRFSRLTPRESQIVDMVVNGMTSKTIASQLKVTTQAIDAHRGRAMKKLRVDSVAMLTRLALAADRVCEIATFV